MKAGRKIPGDLDEAVPRPWLRSSLALALFVAPVLATPARGDWKELKRWAGFSAGEQLAENRAIVNSGTVEAREHRISCKLGGTLESIAFEEGDRVQPGQLLAEIDPTDTRLALDLARAERAGADAELRLRIAGSRPEDIAGARAQVKRAEADLDGAERDLGRMSALVASASGTAKARDDARTRRDAATWALKALREQAKKLEAGSRPEEIDAAKARLASADARIAQLSQQLRDATVKSPIAGLVAEKLAERGELVARGTALAVVTDIDRPWLTVYVAEPDLDRIRMGQAATVVTDGGHSRTGRITFIASQAEFTPKNAQTRDERVKLVYKVKVALDNTDGLFKPGMPAEARIEPQEGRP